MPEGISRAQRDLGKRVVRYLATCDGSTEDGVLVVSLKESRCLREIYGKQTCEIPTDQ